MELDNQSTPLLNFFSGSCTARTVGVALIGFVYQFITCELGREKSNCAIPTLELLNCVYHIAKQESLKRTLK